MLILERFPPYNARLTGTEQERHKLLKTGGAQLRKGQLN